MRPSRYFAILALPASAIAVSLSDFPPQVKNLPSACESVYTADISGCSASDFAGAGCSAACISALYSMVPKVKTACANHGLTGENIIVAFLANQGPGSVCSNAVSESSSMAASSAAQSSSATSAAATTSAPASTAVDTTSVSSQTGSGSSATSSSVSSAGTTSMAGVSSSSTAASSTASPSSSVSGSASNGIVYDPSSTSPGSSAGTSSTSSISPQYTSDHSGGGSPFDTTFNGQASTATAPLALVVAVAVMTLFGMQ